MVRPLIDSRRRRRRPRPTGHRGRQQVSVAKQPCAVREPRQRQDRFPPDPLQQLIFPVIFAPSYYPERTAVSSHSDTLSSPPFAGGGADARGGGGINGDSSDETAALFTALEPAREYQNQSQNPIWLRKLLRYVLIRLMSLTDPPPGLKSGTPSAFSGERNAAPPLPAGS